VACAIFWNWRVDGKLEAKPSTRGMETGNCTAHYKLKTSAEKKRDTKESYI